MARILFLMSAVIFVAGVTTCYFGVQHEIGKIPPEVRAQMSDTDWVGVDWVYFAMIIQAGAGGVLLIALALRARARRRSPVASDAHARGGNV